MPIQKDADGKRSIAVEVDVPGSPEEVWQAIATGPGISSWFVPTTFEEAGGKPIAKTSTFGPGMAPRSAVTAWDPPRTFTTQSDGWGGSPPIGNEWHVEPQGDGTCRVRVINSFTSTSDQWDGIIEATSMGWPGFFRTLQLYMTHFRNAPSALLQFVQPVPGTETEAWQALTTALNVDGLAVGAPWEGPGDTPPLGAGVLEYMHHEPFDALVRLSPPTPGIAALGAFNYGGQSMVALNLYLYGQDAATIAARDTPRWQAWIAQRFPGP